MSLKEIIVIIKYEIEYDSSKFNPELEWEVRKTDIKSKSKNTPFIGKKLKGKALAIYNNKQFVVID